MLPLARNTGSEQLFINIDPTNVFFVDSNAVSLDAFDWISWADNQEAGQDIQLHLPLIWVSTE